MHLRFRVQHTPPRANCQCGFRADLCFSRVKREKGGKYPGFFCISTIRTARRCTATADRQKSAWFRAKMRKIFKNHLDKPCTACYNIERRSERIGYSSLAQSVERVTVNHDVVGSSPTGGASKKSARTHYYSGRPLRTHKEQRVILCSFFSRKKAGAFLPPLKPVARRIQSVMPQPSSSTVAVGAS